MRDRLVAAAYAVGWRGVRVLPEPAAYALFDLLADLAWLRRGTGVARLEANLRRAAPGLPPRGLRGLSRRGMRSYLRYWCDTFRLPDWDRRRVVSTCRAEGDQPVRAALATGRGVVLALAHLGNWDHAGAWSQYELAPVTTVAERLRPEALYRRFLRFREALGMEILPLTGGGDVFGILVRRLRAGGFVPLLADRDLTATGVEVTLCGQPARLAAGPAALALAAGAPLFPVTLHYERLPGPGPAWGTVITFHDQVEVPAGLPRADQVAAMTQACADALSAGIAAYPQDWHMLHRVFVADLDPVRV